MALEDEKDDLSGLTDIEKEALNTPDEQDQPAEEPVEEPAEPEAPAEPAAEPAAEPPAEPAAPEPAAEPEDDDEDLPEINAAPSAPGQIPYVPKWDIKKLNEGLEDLKKKFDDNELSLEDYMIERDKLRDCIAEEKSIFNTTKILNAAQANAAEERWLDEQREFFRDNPDVFDSDIKYAAMGAAISKLSGQFRGKPGRELLHAAKKLVYQEIGAPAPADNKVPATPPKAAKPPIPKTLGSIPSAAPTTGESRFAYIDKLEGVEKERAISKLSKDDRRAYEEE